MINPLKLLLPFRKSARKHKKKFIVFGIVCVSTIIISFCLDDDLYYYYLNMDKGSIIQNEEEDAKREIYKVISKDEVKQKNSKGKKKLNENGGIDATEQEVIDAIESIVGTFGIEWVKGNTNMSDSQAQFILDGLPGLIMMSMKYNILVSSGILQSSLESGWGKNTPTGSNNYFGIKSQGYVESEYWDGSYVTAATNEGEGAGQYSTVAQFRKYESVAQSIMNYGEFLNQNSIYKTGGICQLGMTGDDANVFLATDYLDQIKRIMNAGYATSPYSYIDYAETQGPFLDVERFDDLRDKVFETLAHENGDTGFKEDEWIPAGDTDWLDECGVDKSQLNSKRLAVIQEGRLLYGVCYSQYQNRGVLPPKNPDGTYNIDYSLRTNADIYLPYALDCSAYVQACYLQALNIDIGYYTGAQLYSPVLETISFDEVRPGDIWLRTTPGGGDGGHVVMVLSKNPDGTCNVQHTNTTWVVEGQERGVVHYQANYYVGNGIFRRLKGIDD